MAAVEWTNENSALPTMNFSDGSFEFARSIDGYTMEGGMKVKQRGCPPYCNMPCGNVVLDAEGGRESELDYENVALLGGANLGIGKLNEVSVLNRIADEMGMDTISLGGSLAFIMEAKEKGLIKEDAPEFGDFKKARELALDIAYRRGGELGNFGAEGVMRMSQKLGDDSFAMHVKGLEVSGYNCFIYLQWPSPSPPAR